MLAGHGVCELPGYELCLKYTYAFNWEMFLTEFLLGLDTPQ